MGPQIKFRYFELEVRTWMLYVKLGKARAYFANDGLSCCEWVPIKSA